MVNGQRMDSEQTMNGERTDGKLTATNNEQTVNGRRREGVATFTL